MLQHRKVMQIMVNTNVPMSTERVDRLKSILHNLSFVETGRCEMGLAIRQDIRILKYLTYACIYKNIFGNNFIS